MSEKEYVVGPEVIGPVNVKSRTMWTLVHKNKAGDVDGDEDGLPQLVWPIDEFTVGMLFESEEDAKKSEAKHNADCEDGGHEIPCIAIPITILWS